MDVHMPGCELVLYLVVWAEMSPVELMETLLWLDQQDI